MTISSTSTRNQKIVLAVVLLFLGWLIASMIPKSEAPWDGTTDAYLTNRQGKTIRTLSGEDVPIHPDKSSDYEMLWTASQNESPDPKTVNLPKDSPFFDTDIEDTEDVSSQTAPNAAETEGPEREIANADSVEWSDELKISSESAPDIKSDPPPSLDESLPAIELGSQADADSLAPPIGPLAGAWDSGSETPKSAGEKTDNTDSQSQTAAETLTAAAPSELDTDKVVPLVVPLPVSEAPDAQSESPGSTIVSARPDSGSSPVSVSEPSPAISLPSKTSPVQDQTRSAVQQEAAAQQPVLQNTGTLVPSNPEATLVSGTSPASASQKSSDTEPISNAAASIPANQGNQVTAAYHEEPAPAPALSRPPSVLVYTAGSGETWDSIAKKFSLSPKESEFYAETNSFRFNPDGSIPENAQLLLPKR